jgi:hypothetical protein
VPDIVAACRTPYQHLLGDAYHRLHPHVRLAHEAPLTAAGTVDVTHGTHPLTPLIVRALTQPTAGKAQPVALRVALAGAASSHAPAATMWWMRRIGDTQLDTRQYSKWGRLIEQSGPGAVEFVLRIENGALVYEAVACRFLRLPLRRVPAPQVRARVTPTHDGWHADVVVEWRGHVVCAYAGAMRPLLRTS